ncbi:flavin reductase family protein [Nocardia nova]|uniref:flavin reductase family protein n=1 Tax=Nocardia nova TaxID=37330 RepID=UPI0009ED054F|nr:flavin reductase family protein [Nocardia nova]
MTNLDPQIRFGIHVHAMEPALANSDEVRTVFSGFPAAVVAICALVDGHPRGLVASSLSIGTSYEPPMTLFSVKNDSSTWPALRSAKRVGISVLAEEQSQLCRQMSSKTGNRFADVLTTTTEYGSLFLGGATTWMDCEIVYEWPTGDHTVVVFKIHSVGHVRGAPPLIFQNGSFPRLNNRTGGK